MSYKRINFGELGGLHTWQETYAFMQDSYRNTFGQLAALLGNNVILNGVVLSSGTYSAGWMIVDGVICPFVGGIPGTYVNTEELIDIEAFDDATTKDIFFTKRAIFSNVTGVPFADFLRVNSSILAKMNRLDKFISPFVADGSWVFWNKDASLIPEGWEAVDEAEWKGRVPVILDTAQAEFDVVGKIGGAKTHTLIVSEMPAHSHILTGGLVGQSYSAAQGGSRNSIDSANPSTTSVGGNQAHNNLQPYKVVMFIRFIG